MKSSKQGREEIILQVIATKVKVYLLWVYPSSGIDSGVGQLATSFCALFQCPPSKFTNGLTQDQTTGARDLLAPVFEWLTEVFDTTDLKEAKALLDELC